VVNSIDAQKINASTHELSITLLDLSDFAKAVLSPAEQKKITSIAKKMVKHAGDIKKEISIARKAVLTDELVGHLKDIEENVKLLGNLARDFAKAKDRQNLFLQINARYAEMVKGLTIVLAEASEK